MGQQTLEYRGPIQRSDGATANRRGVISAAVVAAIVLVANVILVCEAAADQSWGALQILLIVGPITNGVLCAVSFAFTPLVRRCAGGAITLHVLASLLPLAGILIDGVLILLMDLHGC